LRFEVLLHSKSFVCAGKIVFQADKFLLLLFFDTFAGNISGFLQVCLSGFSSLVMGTLQYSPWEKAPLMPNMHLEQRT